MHIKGAILLAICIVSLTGCQTTRDSGSPELAPGSKVSLESRDRLNALYPEHDVELWKSESDTLHSYGDPDSRKVTPVSRLPVWLQRRVREAGVSRRASVKTLYYERADGQRLFCLAPKAGVYLVVADEFAPSGWIESLQEP